VADLFERWFEWKSARDKKGRLRRVRSERTLVDYRRMYKLRIRPRFGDMAANTVSQTDVQEWVDELGSEIEPKTIADYHSLLHAVYGWGIHPSRALVVNDPCSDTQLPKRRKKAPKGLRPGEWQLLHRAAQAVDGDAADLLLFLASTGWRWSEAVAAQAMAVDHWIAEDTGESFTYVTMGRVLRREGNNFVFVEDEAKSEAGQRRVRLKGAGERMVLRRIAGSLPTDLILTNAAGKKWRYDNFYSRTWKRPPEGKDDAPNRKRILEEAAKLGLDRPDLTPHWLRHTHVGMSILAGESLTAIQRRIGHASIKTTSDTYGRMVDDASSDGLDKVALMLGDGSAELESSARTSLTRRHASPAERSVGA
jgi:integrase